ncbi:MAG: peptidylprolyl isomerase [Deltaproteobacteria bacterium]|nr:peptidylprolyl isomerase [Deltaproteobacteria bacterium]
MRAPGLVFICIALLSCNREEEPRDVVEDTVIHGSRDLEAESEAPPARETRPERDGDDPAAPLPGLRRRPTSPDPQNGEFTLAEATLGLPEGNQPLFAQLRTDLGRITCKLHADKAPRTVANFVGLARGKRELWDAREAKWTKRAAYDGTIFHRVIPGFMIQGGDTQGDGTGTPGYEIPDELWEGARHDRAGLLCMANRGPNTNGAQFFITDAAAPHLDSSYTIFGECSPTDVVAQIARVPQSGRPRNRPLTPVQILSVRITRGEPPPPPAPRPPPRRPDGSRGPS